jgi:protein involved in polysaccharide export with SLBB domain
MLRIILSIVLFSQAALPAFAVTQGQQDEYTPQPPSFGDTTKEYRDPRPQAPARVQDRPELKPEISEYESFVASKDKDAVPGDEKAPKLLQFGYDFFNKSPSTFAPADNVPVTPDYVIAPGDELQLSVTGRIDGRWTLTVSRDGTINIPKVGNVMVSGIAFRDLKDSLIREIGRFYTGFDLSVSMGALRSIRVYVVGNARVPGAYTVSSLSTMVNALFEAGGPGKTGSMRNIQLKRNGKLVANLDLYALLLNGDKSSDARLVNEDVIFIPPVGPLAGISGDVKRPGIYEINDEVRVTDLIGMAGGFTTTAFRGRVAMQRIVEHRFRDFFEADLADIQNDSLKNFTLRDGDLVKAFSIIDKDSAVNVAGAVTYPGKFGVIKGQTTLADVIKLAGGLMDYASTDAELTRVHLTTAGVQTERFSLDLTGIKNGVDSNPFLLEPNDHVMVRQIPDWKLYTMVKIGGEVKYPGVYPVKKGEKLSSVLERAGGFTDKAFPRGVVFIRESARVQQQKNLEEIAQRLEKQLLVEGSGKMQTTLSPEETTAAKEEMSARAKFVETLKTLKAQGRVYIKLKSIRSLKGSDYDIEMEENDEITIPAKSSVVNVAGAVMSQGSYVYSSSGYKSYVNMAGGFADYSKPGKTFVLKADGSARKAKKMLFFSTNIEPGDTVVVPERFDRIAWLREIRDISQILVNVALMAGVVVKVF